MCRTARVPVDERSGDMRVRPGWDLWVRRTEVHTLDILGQFAHKADREALLPPEFGPSAGQPSESGEVAASESVIEWPSSQSSNH